MLKHPILATKLHQPALHPKRVRRPQLISRLNAGLDHGGQVSLISAPAGFGKTTCACEWLGSLDLPFAWLSLDAADNDATRFFAYFLSALQQVDETIGREIQSAIQSGQVPPVEILTSILVNDIMAVKGKFLLVLDDFHAVQEPILLQFLEMLVSNQPATLHLVLITREDPMLPLARLRANNLLTEIRAGDLRFSGPETGSFLNGTLDLSLSEADIGALENRTEGWVVGLQLAGLSMRGRGDPAQFIAALSGSHRYILGYLTEEVINRQTEEIQNFLLQTSILDKLCADLCEAVTGRADSRDLLEHLYTANLFLIPLDDDGLWYRYHHLFADLLRSQQRRLNPDRLAQLHQCASAWFETAGLPGEAIEHALAAADYAQVVQLLEKHAMPLVTQGYARTVEGWMQAVPPEWHTQSPRANLAFASMHLLRGSYSSAALYLNQAKAAISQGDPAAPETTALQAELFALQANFSNVQGRPAESIDLANRALQGIAEDNETIRSLAYLGLGGAYRLQGDYPRLTEAYQNAIRSSQVAGVSLTEMMAVSALTLMAIRHGQLRMAYEVGTQTIDRQQQKGAALPPIAATVIGVLGMIALEWNQANAAQEYFAQTLKLSSLSGHNAGLVFTKILQSRLLRAEGDLEAAAEAVHEAAGYLPLGVPAWLKPEVPAQQVIIALAQGHPLTAETVLLQNGVSPEKPENQIDDLLALAHLRLLVYRVEHGQPDNGQAAITLASRLVTGAAAGQRMDILLPALLLRARTYAALGQAASELDDLQLALELAAPQGYIRTFVDEGPSIYTLLRRKLEQGVMTAYVQQLQDAFQQAARSSSIRDLPGPATPPGGEMDLVEPLSERELEVLRLIAEGLKYEEISGRLVISLNTVRFHVKSIYGKLNVNNRTHAVRAARRLRLIE